MSIWLLSFFFVGNETQVECMYYSGIVELVRGGRVVFVLTWFGQARLLRAGRSVSLGLARREARRGGSLARLVSAGLAWPCVAWLGLACVVLP